ncbi:PIN domain-containing protein [Halorubrum sp. AD140]|nr:PIN domain-containing protein [Halorubrum sp. AD140]MDZ5811707.1 PIN domain-containing protein [Halorubrum sp. AD140]
MKLVIDANVVISALIADSKTRELVVTLEPDLLTPAFVHDEIENYEDLIDEKSGLEPHGVEQHRPPVPVHRGRFCRRFLSGYRECERSNR